MTPRADVLTRVDAVNLGLESFADALRSQGAPVVQVDWSPPAGGDAEMLGVLTRLWGRHGERGGGRPTRSRCGRSRAARRGR